MLSFCLVCHHLRSQQPLYHNGILRNIVQCKDVGVVVSMFDFHRSDRGSNPGRGGKIS